MKVLYLSPLIPAVSGNGGKRAVYNHLSEAMREGVAVTLFAVDVEDSGECLPPEITTNRSFVLPRGLPRARSLRGRVCGALHWIFGRRPRAAAVVTSRRARSEVAGELNAHNYDLIVVDHLNAWGLLPQHGVAGTPVHYIAHNVESDVLDDQLKSVRKASLAWFRLSIELKKMRSFEREVLAAADRIIVIASTDMRSPLLQEFKNKTLIWPELPEPKEHRWMDPGGANLLFVGSAAYFPNRDAIEWLVGGLMPELTKLLPNARLKIAGTDPSAFPRTQVHNSVDFEGYVPVARLEELHRCCDLFVCPVVLGSGIKIKVLEASAYGMPIAATRQSLGGIEYLHTVALEIERDASMAARVIFEALLNRSVLSKVGAQTAVSLVAARASRRKLFQLN